MAVDLGVAYLSVAASTGGLSKDIKGAMGGVESSMGASGKRSGGLFTGAFKGALGVLGGLAVVGKVGQFLASANAEARESIKVNALTANVIKTTGGAAKVTTKQVADLATAISNKTGIDDEAVQSSANLLLTFKNVKNEVGKGSKIFDRATAAAQDLAASGFGDANGSAKMLGKALNDPVKGITALGRAGVTFTDGQKKQIKTMVESGNVLGAQKIIMKEVESQVGGAAAATATASDKMKVKWGNLKETLGTAFVMPAIEKLSTFLSPLIDGISAGIPKVQNFFKSFSSSGGASALAGVLTLMSPLKLLFQAVLPILPQLAATFGGLGSQLAASLLPVLGQLAPVIGQVVAALSGGLQKVILALLPALTQIASAVLPVLSQVIAAIVPVVIQLVQAFLPFIDLIAQLIVSLLPPLVSLITGLLPVVTPLIGAVLSVVQALMPMVGVILQLVQTLLPPLMAVLNALIPVIVWVASIITGQMVGGLKLAAAAITWLIPVISSLIGWVGNVAAAIANWVAGAIPAIGSFVSTVSAKLGEAITWFTGLPGRIMGALGGLGSLLVTSGQKLVDGFLSGIKGAWDTLVGWVKGAMENLRGLWPFSPAKWGPFSGHGYVTYSGAALTGDFAKSLAAGAPAIRRGALTAMNAATLSPAMSSATVGMSIAATMPRRSFGPATPVASGPSLTQINYGVDAAELAARNKAQWEHAVDSTEIQYG